MYNNNLTILILSYYSYQYNNSKFLTSIKLYLLKFEKFRIQFIVKKQFQIAYPFMQKLDRSFLYTYFKMII